MGTNAEADQHENLIRTTTSNSERVKAHADEKDAKARVKDLQANAQELADQEDKVKQAAAKNLEEASRFKATIQEAKEKKATAEQQAVAEGKKVREATDKKAKQMTVEAKVKSASKEDVKAQKEIESTEVEHQERSEELVMKSRVAKEKFEEL